MTNAHGDIVNLYTEPQYAVYQSAVGSPKWQIFGGVTFKFPIAKGQKER